MKSKLLSIQALRAIAATAVVWHHSAGTILEESPHPSLPFSLPWMNLGAAGVDIFFVISGFVIFFIAPEMPVGWSGRIKFLKNRAIRIYPIYLVFTLLTIFFLLFRSTRAELTAKYLIASCFLFPVTSPINGGFHPVLDQGWTLFYEVGFYLLFALLLFLDLRQRLVGILVLLASLFGVAHLFAGLPPCLAIWHDAIIFEFVLGCAIAYLYRRGRLPTGYTALAIMLLGWALFAASTRLSGDWNRFLVWGLPAVLVVAGAIGFEVSPRDQGHWFAWLSPLGDASYSLYLCHSLVVFCLGSLAKRNAFGAGWVKQTLALLVCIALCIVFGLAVHNIVEMPLMRLCKGKRKPLAIVGAPAAAAL